jgi:hypothetical protein
VVTRIGATEITGWDEARYKEALAGAGYPAAVDKSRINYGITVLILFVMVLYVTMVYGPIAAFLVELSSRRGSATPRCRCPTTSGTAGSVAGCRCSRRRWWRGWGTSTRGSGIDHRGPDDGRHRHALPA